MAGITILAHEGPMLRAYGAALRHRNVAIDRVVAIAPAREAASGKPVGRWLPGGLRASYCVRLADARNNHWPRRLKREASALVAAMRGPLAERFDFFEAFFEDLEGPFAAGAWGVPVSTVLADGLGDPALGHALEGAGTVIFTGGGLVPPSLLATPGADFLHVHPGCLPHVRGADGLLWSTLVRGRPGCTAFFMTAALDEGPVVRTEEPEPVRFPEPATGDDLARYRAVYSFYDPCLRADMLARVLARGLPSRGEATAPSGGLSGPVFPFMSGRLRRAALAAILGDA